MELYEDLIVEFGRLINVVLHVDKNGACSIDVDQSFKIQIELFDRKEAILIASHLSELSPGKFRENILRDGLKANSEFPREVTFAYSPKNNKFSLFTWIPTSLVTAELLSSTFLNFLAKAQSWKTAIDQGTTYTLLTSSSKR